MWLNSLSYVCQEIASEPFHKILQENPLKSLYNEIVKNKYWISIVKCITYQHWCNKKKDWTATFTKKKKKKQKSQIWRNIYIMTKKKEYFLHTQTILKLLPNKLLLQWCIHTYYNENDNFMIQNGNESSNHTIWIYFSITISKKKKKIIKMNFDIWTWQKLSFNNVKYFIRDFSLINYIFL